MGRKRSVNGVVKISTRDLLQVWNEYYVKTNFGIGIQCSRCGKWRLTYHYQESKEVPDNWNCSMLKIKKKGSKWGNCSIPSQLTEYDFAEEEFCPGALVMAKMRGFEWWPAMVENCPDSQDYFVTYVDGEQEYHVTFFGHPPTRSWVAAQYVDEFDEYFSDDPPTKRIKRSARLEKALEQADEAAALDLKERLKKYSFATRFNGRWGKIKKKDAVLLPPTCSGLMNESKPAGVKSPAPNGNRSVKSTPTPTPRIRKKALGSKKRTEMSRETMDRPSACLVDRIRNGASTEDGDRNENNSSEEDVSTEDGDKNENNPSEEENVSTENGDRNENNPSDDEESGSEEDVSADDEDNEEYDDEKPDADERRYRAVPMPPLVELDNSPDRSHSSFVEVKNKLRLFEEYAVCRNPSLFRKYSSL